MSSSTKPILGITMGDPAGIGPEVIAKASAQQSVYELARPIVVGDAAVIREAVKIANVDTAVNPVGKVSEARFEFGAVDVLDLKNVDIASLKLGAVSAMAGEASFDAVTTVISLAMNHEIDATVTAPINKESINKAGHHFSGHTEIYGEYTSTKDYTMLLVDGNLKVVHVSTHVSLRKACDLVKKERILKVIQLANEACLRFGIKSPLIGVAGLNPHASDGGLFGWEEEKEIAPAVELARQMHINAEGPIPPDTLFSKARGGQYDIAVAMYHDQGHIPLKVLGFLWDEKMKKWESVNGINITLGLPIIRVSVDHGTAFDIAGQGKASEQSLLHAIEYAAKMAEGGQVEW
ncbi:4-hydroxythreonine-4-phosphate dehydrogenase PdxA [Sedimentisphaera salicampi]|uniref:4-hydroxythreonine-4-phosphate dehydrogenase 2 n=1 Tax=Sedimentisphaera salicampi TaxID=1941349 RepID=A0A1W6LLQ8_9BACT|nr:4-hydroxythreonine-4-phosphate dehydrogenase PdxA [Sedimentisphaera salicampi]ARN56728.1 4-hydroxythreonine-4-phosphate dehydrogenase 2 [Sedimentisphaera salicampi]